MGSNMNTQEFIKLISLSPEQAEAKRLREIDALQAAGVATWDEIRERTQIVRRRILRDVNKE